MRFEVLEEDDVKDECSEEEEDRRDTGGRTSRVISPGRAVSKRNSKADRLLRVRVRSET